MSPHAIVSEGELPDVGVDYAYLGPEGSQLSSSHFCWMAARFGMETIVVEVRH